MSSSSIILETKLIPPKRQKYVWCGGERFYYLTWRVWWMFLTAVDEANVSVCPLLERVELLCVLQTDRQVVDYYGKVINDYLLIVQFCMNQTECVQNCSFDSQTFYFFITQQVVQSGDLIGQRDILNALKSAWHHFWLITAASLPDECFDEKLEEDEKKLKMRGLCRHRRNSSIKYRPDVCRRFSSYQ